MTDARLKSAIALVSAAIIMIGMVAFVCMPQSVAKETKPVSITYKATPHGKPFRMKGSFRWKFMLTSARNIAEVGGNGKITPGDPGIAKITIVDLKTMKSKKVMVKVAYNQKLAVSSKEINATFGDKPVKLGVKTNSKEHNRISYHSSNKKVVKVDQKGMLRVKGAGQAVITIRSAASKSYHNAKITVPVSVEKQAQELTIKKSKYTVSITDTTKKIKTKSSTDNKVTFKSDNEEVAKVEADGTIVPVAIGETTVKITQSGDKNHSKATKEITVKVRQPDSYERIQAAIEWACNIAADDNFHYGAKPIAWMGAGCYFCGTTDRKVRRGGQQYEKTYTCMPFITAAFAHGAQDPEMLAVCERRGSLSLTDSNFTKYSCWDLVGRCNQLSMADLQPGDVLCDYSADNKHGHLCMYIGDGKIVEASSAGGAWTPESITVRSDAAGRLSRYSREGQNYVMRYSYKQEEGNQE